MFDLLMVGSVGLHGGVLGYRWEVLSCIVKSFGLNGRVLSYMVEIAGLHGKLFDFMLWVLCYMIIDGSIWLYDGECLGYIVGNVEVHDGSVELHGGEC